MLFYVSIIMSIHNYVDKEFRLITINTFYRISVDLSLIYNQALYGMPNIIV